MSEKRFNNTRTISYVRKVNTITGEVNWEPLWELSDKYPDCGNCVKNNTKYCKKETAPAWFGAPCANWLPKDVNFKEINSIMAECVHSLLKYANTVWAPCYAEPLASVAMRIWDIAQLYYENPLADYSAREYYSPAEKARRARYAKKG